MKKVFIHQQGQTLVLLLMFMVFAIMVTTAAVAMIVTNIKATDKLSQGTSALTVAESGAENAILKLLRDPSYSGETITIGEGVATVTVAGTNPKTIVSTGAVNNFTRKIQVIVDMSNKMATVSAWKEIY